MRIDISNDDFSKLISESLEEVVKRRVVRQGKVVKKTICPDGLKSSGGRCVKMKATEKIKRAKSAKKSARKRRSKQAAIARKIERSKRKLKR
jgi:hypothetical protein